MSNPSDFISTACQLLPHADQAVDVTKKYVNRQKSPNAYGTTGGHREVNMSCPLSLSAAREAHRVEAILILGTLS